MILVSTYNKLLAKGATIYRVDFEAFSHNGLTIPASHEHFATRAQAVKNSEQYGTLTSPTITVINARDFDPWQDR